MLTLFIGQLEKKYYENEFKKNKYARKIEISLEVFQSFFFIEFTTEETNATLLQIFLRILKNATNRSV